MSELIPLIFASSNSHKVDEIIGLLGSTYFIRGLKEFGILVDIEETGNSFAENAEIKARYVFNKTGLNVFSDDSGLEIEALGGEPGIYSARYSAEKDSHSNINKVLTKLAGIKNRKAFFSTVICLIYEGKPHYFEGQIEGSILNSVSGKGGFGYDPIFLPKGQTKSFAELSSVEKNRISHRSIALNKMRDFLEAKKDSGSLKD